MSHHILHILSHGSYLRKERGFLIYENKQKGETKRLPIEDIKALVIAAKGVVLSDVLIASLMKKEAIILHCDESFLPIALTAALQRVINREATLSQVNTNSGFHKALWQKVLSHKVLNQAEVLKYAGEDCSYLREKAKLPHINEAICARYYWRRYFKALGYAKQRREAQGKDLLNAQLNYGYAVMGALCHRSIVVHGLNPVFGIHHQMRYRANPLVYDLMEPLRAFIEKSLYDFLQIKAGTEQEQYLMREWASFCLNSWKEIKVRHKNFSLKLLDAVDYYISSTAQAFAANNREALWIPQLNLEKQG